MNHLHEQSPSYSQQGDEFVRAFLVKHAADLGLSPDDAAHLDLDRIYWTEFEPRHLPSNGPIGYPPRPNPDAGKFVRSIPLSYVPITNLPDTGEGDDRFRISVSNEPGQTAGGTRNVIDPSKFAQYLAEENNEPGGFKARYKQDVAAYFDGHHDDLRQYQRDKAQLALDEQQAQGHAVGMGPGDYKLLRQALFDQPKDPSLTGSYYVHPLEEGSVSGSAPYVSPSALVVKDSRPNGATYLYLPGEPQPYLRFNDDAAAKQYIQNCTDGPAAAHKFAATYFSQNDATGNWDGRGIEDYFNHESDYRRSHAQPTVADTPGTYGDKDLINSKDITDDPFGKQVDIAKDKALDQADFDITSQTDKNDKRHYDEAGKYWYLPGRQLVQLAYAKTGEQKNDAFASLAVDMLSCLVLDGLGKGFSSVARGMRPFAKEGSKKLGTLMDDRSLPPGKPSSGGTGDLSSGGSGHSPASIEIKDGQLPPAASVSENELQPYGNARDVSRDGKGNRYWHYNGKHYLLQEDPQLSRPGKPVYHPVDPDNPYAFAPNNTLLVPDGNGGLTPQKLGLAGGSDSDEEFKQWLDDFNSEEESDFDRYLRREQRPTPTPASGASNSGAGTSGSSAGTDAPGAGTSASGAGTSAQGVGAPALGEPTPVPGITKHFAYKQISLDTVTTLPPLDAKKIAQIGPGIAERFMYYRVSNPGARNLEEIVTQALEESLYDVTPMRIKREGAGRDIHYLKAEKGEHSFYVYPKKARKNANNRTLTASSALRKTDAPPLPHVLAAYHPDPDQNGGYLYFATY